MSINKFNSEGYFDPTVYKALTRIEKAAKKAAFKPLVFVCSPFAGNTEYNTEKARDYCRFAVSRNCIPIAPHLLFPQFMDDQDPAQRELALLMGTVLMCKCSELWVFGGNITKGMALEIDKAKSRNMIIRYFNEKCEEVIQK
jgi:hypothetical protein